MEDRRAWRSWRRRGEWRRRKRRRDQGNTD
jgi:hypothetical protein